MPISFASQSHGRIAVGFFNIETDMLLMDRYFMFASDFCAWVIDWTENADCHGDEKVIYVIQEPAMIGNLSGAIYGIEFSGFIGEVYKHYPFPKDPAGFKQKPYGFQNRDIVEQTIQPFAYQEEIRVSFSEGDRLICFGDYVFHKAVFQEIIGYVEAGGVPRWLNGQPPDYVKKMAEAVEGSNHWLFTNP